MMLVSGSDFWQSTLEFTFRYSFEHFSQQTRSFATVLGTYPLGNAAFPRKFVTFWARCPENPWFRYSFGTYLLENAMSPSVLDRFGQSPPESRGFAVLSTYPLWSAVFPGINGPRQANLRGSLKSWSWSYAKIYRPWSTFKFTPQFTPQTPNLKPEATFKRMPETPN